MPELATKLMSEKEQTEQKLRAILACIQTSRATARGLRMKNNSEDVEDLLGSLAMSELSVQCLIGDID